MAKSKIEWTEQTWNPITGCTKVSAGCKNCYAESIAKRFWGNRKFSDIIVHDYRIAEPLKWKKPRLVFVNSMSDLFHPKIKNRDIACIFEVMRLTPQHTYQVLTKRPEKALEFFKWWYKFDETASINDNVWLGVSIENKDNLNRLEVLKRFPCKIKFVSFEPLLENIGEIDLSGIDWVIVGGESGHNKRPFDCDWAREIRDECALFGVPFFMKQVDKEKPIPEDLMIREYPKNNNIEEK